jgi:hypothetical protein
MAANQSPDKPERSTFRVVVVEGRGRAAITMAFAVASVLIAAAVAVLWRALGKP